uniref:Huntingtin n=1 Tax=Photinus pyralis TaxID=7054 RepID=A0A1Y1K0T3_PHOPY
MATQDKLLKSLESLRSLMNTNSTADLSQRKKEKIHHCNIITDTIGNATIRVAPNFDCLLGLCIEALLQLCDDQESDVRMIADECLNRLIKAVSDGNMSKIQIELHKEIKNNGTPRSLRAALWRFAELAHYIRPQKGKPYVANLMPCIIKISARTEEMVHETLAGSFPKIMVTLGCFTTDNDIKALMKAFLNNISNSSAVIRRTAITCILALCLNCRKPYVFVTYTLNNLLDLLIPVQDDHSSSLILGVLGCLKVVLPHIKNCSGDQEIKDSFGLRKEVNETPVAVDRLLQVYELCLYYLPHEDHNITNAALESLNVLLQNCSSNLKSVLTSPTGINKSRIVLDSNIRSKPRSPSQMSVATPLSGDENSESDLLDSLRPDIEKWIDESKLSVMNITYAKTSEMMDKTLHYNSTELAGEEGLGTSNYSNIDIGIITDDSYDSIKRDKSIVETFDKMDLSDTSTDDHSFVQPTDDKSVATTSDDLYQEIDIGSFQDADVPLYHCVRLIAKSFLLTGAPHTTISDKKVRVSVKSLSLSCISTIVEIYPSVLLTYLDKNYIKILSQKQALSDVLLYKDHTDPQLRGVVRIIIGKFLRSVILGSGDQYQLWINQNSALESNEDFEISNLVSILLKGLEDESSNCLRQTLQSLNVCLKYLLESETNAVIKPILDALPRVAQNPYWLVKVSLLDIVTNIYYVTVHHVIGSSEFQDKILHNVLFELLKYDNQKVRSACSSAIVQIIPLLYFKQNLPNESTTTNKAKFFKNVYFSNLFSYGIEMNYNQKRLLLNMPSPFSSLCESAVDSISDSLSRIVLSLMNFLLCPVSKFFMFGCVETLCMLAHSYPPTLYPSAWGCFPIISTTKQDQNVWPITNSSGKELCLSSSMDVFRGCVSFLCNSTMAYDLKCHLNLLKLSGNLICGLCLPNLKPKTEINEEDTQSLWDMFTDEHLSNLTEQFFVHILKLLNIFYHVIEEISPHHVQSKPVLGNLPTSTLSPIKRRKSDLGEKYKSITQGRNADKEDKLDKKLENVKLNLMGQFANLPHYLKLYDLLKTSYSNYKTTLDTEASEQFLELLRTTLLALSQLLEIAGLFESGRVSEEILNYCCCTFNLEPSYTVECVQQLLKSLFRTNLTGNITNIALSQQNVEDGNYSFYHTIFRKPYTDISVCINGFNNSSKLNCDGDSVVMGYLHRRNSKKSLGLPRGADSILASYIRLFEPMVIKSLKQYTITSNVRDQCCVLQLLCQLVQLRVNYCLLDSEQIFIGFVLKQFEYLEEGQIPFANELIPQIFNFLVHLSYGKQHSKSIISVPKIIQLCDGLMASGQPLLTHCIPALEPIIEDIFLCRNKSNTSDFNELETTREVLLSMLLRLLEYPDVIRLLTLILNESKYCDNSTDRWLKWSRQVSDVFLPMLRQNKITIANKSDIISVRKFVYVLNPSVFKPLNEVLFTLFDEPPLNDSSLRQVIRWLGKTLTLFLVILQVKEELLLLKIVETQTDYAPLSVFSNVTTTSDPLNVSNTISLFSDMSPEAVFVRYIFRIIDLAIDRCTEVINSECTQVELFLLEEISSFLLVCTHIFQSGSHCKIANTAIHLVNEEHSSSEELPINRVNANIIRLSPFFPTLTIEWCYLLTLLNYNDRKFWCTIMQLPESYGIVNKFQDQLVEQKLKCINLEIARIGGMIAFCDGYVDENIGDAEQLTWFLVHNIQTLVRLCDEDPIYEFFSSLHRNPSASGLVLQAINAKCLPISDITFRTKTLKSIENIHPTQVGALLCSLVPNFLDCRELTLSRLTANLASRKIELLLTMSMEEVCNQLAKEDLMRIMDLLVERKLVKKHETLVSLLNRLATQYYDISPLEFDQSRAVNPEYIKNLQVNKAWYISQVKSRCRSNKIEPEMGEVLSHLDYGDLLNIMSNKDFNVIVLKDCITWSVNFAKENHINEEPDLLRASINVLIKNVGNIRSLLPKSHQIYRPFGRKEQPQESKYSHRVTELYSDNLFWNFLYDIIPAVTRYIDSLTDVVPSIPSANLDDFVKFAVVCLESINFMVDLDKNINIHYVDMAVTCSKVILTNSCFRDILVDDNVTSWLCSAVNSLYKLVFNLLLGGQPLPDIPKYGLSTALENLEKVSRAHAVHQLSVLICWVEKHELSSIPFPKTLYCTIKDIIVALGRKPFAYSYLLIPLGAWKNGLQAPNNDTEVPPLPIEFLQEVDVLEEFIFRTTLLGWTSRQQFEETWMCLLSVLNTNAMVDTVLEDANTIIHVTSLSITAITTLLLQAVSTPVIGDINISEFVHISRDVPIDINNTCLTKLKHVHDILQNKFNEHARLFNSKFSIINVFNKSNLEKLHPTYSFGQLSVEYLLISSRIVENDNESRHAAQVYQKQQNILRESGLDLNSCLQFLIDLYSQWIKGQSTPLRILYEVVKSILVLSDLFTDRFQFAWMLDVCLDLLKVHTIEDEIVQQYLVIIVCKAAAVLTPDMDTYEIVKKLIAQNLKSGFLPSKIASLHGLLYVVQGCVLGNTRIGGLSEEMQLILPIAVEYIENYIHLLNGVSTQSLEHTLLVWALAFYLIENIEQSYFNPEFIMTVIQAAISYISHQKVNAGHVAILKGLERLVLKRSISERLCSQLVKLSLDVMKNGRLSLTIPAFQLLLTCMYMSAAEEMESTQSDGIIQSNPDNLVQAIEQISAIFDYIKKGYSFEVEVLCGMLPNILNDFFPPSDILTKVLGEFLSPQQPHPKLLSRVVFKVFQSAIDRSQLFLLQDWVVFSLSNFTQSFSIGMATWCLTCFFISASINKWLRAFFPYVQSRIGRYEYEDRKMLCIAGADFYRNLSNDKQKEAFVSTFNKVKDKADMPFHDLLGCL